MLSLKKAFSIIELSVVVIIISILFSAVLISKQLIASARINKIIQDIRDVEIVMSAFQGQFDCLPGDCNFKQLPSSIYTKTPSACFNLNNDYITPLTTSIITTLNSGEIDSPAKRTCAFYEMQALEPVVFGGNSSGTTIAYNSLFAINNANAIGKGLLYFNGNPILAKITSNQQNVPTNISLPATFYTGIGYLANTTLTSDISSARFITQTQTTDISSIVNMCSNNSLCATQGQSYSFTYGTGANAITIIYSNNGIPVVDVIPQGSNTSSVIFVSWSTPLPKCSNGTSLDLCAIFGTLNAKDKNGNSTTLNNIFNQYKPVSTISQSILTATNPIIPGFDTSAMWDLRTIGYRNQSATGFYPYELTKNPATFTRWAGKLSLIARSSSNINDLIDTTDMAAFSSSFALKLDQKFDDGMPYTGNIIAGKNNSDLMDTTGCTNILGPAVGVAYSTATYVKSNNIGNGCLITSMLKINN